MYEDEFELTFNLSGEEPQPEQAAQEPPVPPKPKAAAPVVDEPTRVMVLEKPQPAPQPEMPEPVQEEPEKTPAPTVQAAANGRCVLISGGDRGIGAAAARAFYAAGYRVAVLYHSNVKAAAELEKHRALSMTPPKMAFTGSGTPPMFPWDSRSPTISPRASGTALPPATAPIC